MQRGEKQLGIFGNSNLKSLGMNDSLDVMGKEFLKQYQDAMVESNAYSSKKNMSPMVGQPQAGEYVKQLVEENESLKKLLEQMKIDMEHVV